MIRGVGDLCRRGLHRLTVDTIRRVRRGQLEEYVACGACLAARINPNNNRAPGGSKPRSHCRRGLHALEGANVIQGVSAGRPFRRCRACARVRQRAWDRLRLMTREVPYHKAVAFARRTLEQVRLRREDLEDIASEAYLHYLEGQARTGNARAPCFTRDVLDAWRAFTGSRNKHPRPRLITNVEDGWFAARPA